MKLPRFRHMFKNRALVLMYHSINTPGTDPWDLSVSPDNFEEHLGILKHDFSIISADELVSQTKSGKVRNRSAVITFDDGYLDNYVNAKPLLEKYSVPASFFITDSYLGGQFFWWDELKSLVVHTHTLPQVFSITFRNETVHFDLGSETVLTDDLKRMQGGFKFNMLPTLRTQLYMKLWHMFSPLLKDEQQKFLKSIREWAGPGAAADVQHETGANGSMTMTQEQVKKLSDSPLFTIGCHTSTHPSLSDHPHNVQFREITENLQFLQSLTGREITLFAYPSGKYDPVTISILKEIGFKGAFTTNTGPVVSRADPYKIKRFQIRDMNGEQFEKALGKWIRD